MIVLLHINPKKNFLLLSFSSYIFLCFIYLLISNPISLRATPTNEVIFSADSLIKLSKVTAYKIDSLSDEINDFDIGYFQPLISNKKYDSLIINIRSNLKESNSLRVSLISSFNKIRESLTTMGDMQVYQGILSEILLTNSRLNNSEQQLLFNVGMKENQIVSNSAKKLTYCGIIVGILGLLFTVISIIKSRGKCSRKSIVKSNPCIFSVIIVFTAILIAIIFFAGNHEIQNQPSWWTCLIVIVSGLTLAFLVQYAYDTKSLARNQSELLGISKKPIVSPYLVTERNNSVPEVRDHLFYVRAYKSPVHAYVQVIFNIKLNDKQVSIGTKYDGKEPWLVDCYGWARGHFDIETILNNSSESSPLSFQQIKDDLKTEDSPIDKTLRISLYLRSKRWDEDDSQFSDGPTYEYKYNFELECFEDIV